MNNAVPPLTDRELVTKARRGDTGAFHQLVDRHAVAMHGLAWRLLGNAADAEDVTQECFAAAFGSVRAFRQEASVKTWLTQILVRQAARFYNARKRRRILHTQTAPPLTAPSAQRASDTRMDLAAALQALGAEHREVIVLRELHGLSYAQIAEVLKVPAGTVESRLFRARRELQNLLKDYMQ